MKRRDLERHLRDHGCREIDEGGNHTRWAGVEVSAVSPTSGRSGKLYAGWRNWGLCGRIALSSGLGDDGGGDGCACEADRDRG